MEFTREQIIESAKHCLKDDCYYCPLSGLDCRNIKDKFVASLPKENEPAPSANDTSSKENIVYKDDSTALKICQGALLKIEKCSSDGWARGYCIAVRESLEMMKAGEQENNV